MSRPLGVAKDDMRARELYLSTGEQLWLGELHPVPLPRQGFPLPRQGYPPRAAGRVIPQEQFNFRMAG